MGENLPDRIKLFYRDVTEYVKEKEEVCESFRIQRVCEARMSSSLLNIVMDRVVEEMTGRTGYILLSDDVIL